MRAAPHLCSAFTLLAMAAAQEWPRFRGPNGSGVLEVEGLPAGFGPDENVAWRVRVPYSASSPILADERVLLATRDGEELIVCCFARTDGAERWQRRLARPRRAELHENNDPAAATPVTAGGRVFAFFHELGVVAFDLDGKQLWLRPLGPFVNRYGMGSSPIVAGDSVLLLCDQEYGSYLVALDVATGEVKWRRERVAMSASWTTPVLHPWGAGGGTKPAGPRQVITFGNFAAHGYALGSGEPLWQGIGLGVCPVSSPLVAGDLLFVCAPAPAEIPAPDFTALAAVYDADKDGKLAKGEFGNPMFAGHFGRLDGDGDGYVDAEEWEKGKMSLGAEDYGLVAYDLTAEPDGGTRPEAWRLKKGVAAVSTPIVYRDVLYMVKDGGILSSVDPKTGEVWKRDRLGDLVGSFFASPVASDGRVYFPCNPGTIAIVEAGRDWRLLGVADFGEEIRATPAIGKEGALFVRTATTLYCLRAPR